MMLEVISNQTWQWIGVAIALVISIGYIVMKIVRRVKGRDCDKRRNSCCDCDSADCPLSAPRRKDGGCCQR